ncbi:FAD-dependent 5-carboxymethylaminomethyl-2-thiouridine(34) oxidoreductase MnmC [Caulobacter segnis]|uniref:FAD-dependent 5-carboxymethylaminomethyl-2-thiouridine(34) oxidoreductase MnmC n=1 Tax=Caulobacter segnis TaxID=88688 RepID=UPI00241037F3|nr:FAD-dependent 5-carboxymethylaminomethyl-2-thiouridine(34) oxidoreductase MnmC [Caulobacter segnis]MDG2520980.1 FAD-dependent 5-carboxymethylaminomethyl-2-thiouridine(34) oxidoreductase MnmC [Caulobacter segnis]
MTEKSASSPLSWRDDGLPASRLYGDVYFSSDDGLAETEAVFLQGCGLPDGWRGRDRFVVGELGFGTGLNIAALLDLWRRERPADGRLHIFSIEAHPITAEEAARALSRWPRIAEASQALIDRWPGQAAGFHRVELPEFRAVLDLAVMDAAAALASWSGMADAWFLDGFSPALNPAMWSDEVLALVAQRSAPGARAATFTVAGQVRRGLTAADFTVEKKPGYGRKRERLEAYLPTGMAEGRKARSRVAVIGGGIAGASAAQAVRALGGEAVIVDPRGLGGAASGNPAALVTPRLDAGDGPAGRLFAQAMRRAAALYEAIPGAVIAKGVLQLEAKEKDSPRFDRIAASPLFEPSAMTRLDGDATAAVLGEAEAPGALRLEEALVIQPAAALAAWAGEVIQTEVSALERSGDGWRLLDAEGGEILTSDAVILAAGMGCQTLLPETPLQPVRGQASFTDAVPAPAAAAFGGYVIPTREGGVLFGATHDRDVTDEARRTEDDARNLAVLAARAPRLAERLTGVPLQSRAAVRATTPDRLPSAGAVGDGLYLLTGMGSRGFCAAPLLAEHLAALIVGAPSPLPRELAAAVNPGRFAARRP